MNRTLSIIVTLLLVLALPQKGKAQDSELGNWLIFFGNKQINSKFNWHHEVQYRNYDFIGDLEQLLLRTGLGYNLTDNVNVLLGYGFIHSENYVDDQKVNVDEHRIYQQVIAKQKAGRVSLQHRYRYEQRWVEGDFRQRFRYFLALNVPLNNPEVTDKTIYVSAYNEIFLNVGDNVFDRDRLYGGMGYKLNKTFRFEVGYMNQFFENGGRDQLNFVVFVSY